MKKMKIYIVTYKRSGILNDTLKKLFESDFSTVANTEVNIINNHSEFSLNPEFKEKVNVLHNVLRPDWSNGNLAENWNQALLGGFRDLSNPDTEYLVTMQNDTSVHREWCSNLLEMHRKYNFIVGRYGDNLVSYTAESVKRIGMWDENFSGIGYKEADYWLRALIHNKNNSCINDTLHGIELNNENALELDTTQDRRFEEELDSKTKEKVLKRKPDDSEQREIWSKSRGGIYKLHAWNYFKYKWDNTWISKPEKIGWVKYWSDEFKNNPPDQRKSKCKMFMKYIYFEKDMYDLKAKNYLL
jgi:hypothetical protein